MSGGRWYWMNRRTFMAVKASEVSEGDLYANGGTVTAVHVGPCPTPESGGWKRTHKTIPRGKTLIVCGESFSTLGNSGNPVIVGRIESP